MKDDHLRLQELEAENRRLKAAVTRADADCEAAQSELEAERIQLQRARAELIRTAAQFDRALEEFRREHLLTLSNQTQSSTALALDGLLTVFAALERTASVPELLAGVTESLTHEFSRVAVIEIRGNRLHGGRHTGFDRDVSTMAIPLCADSLLARAFTSGQLETLLTTSEANAETALPFGGSPGCAIAMPLAVDGKTVALIYADDSDAPDFAGTAPHSRLKYAELLRQHARLVLFRISEDQRTVTELRGFAVMLVEELAFSHAQDVSAGMSSLECQHRLRKGVELSRGIYAQRVAGEHRAAAAFFNDELVAKAEAATDSPFQRDLSSVLGTATSPSRGRVVTMKSR
jgi:hypothetical protein